ncbi:MAG: 2-dehydropantoate 2-reductase [Pseudolabrys sp.]|nr:2-dehydropantoate 2-reductase [Pseudolabrys sp.]
MRIAAMAAGAVGGYFAARLQAAGHDVFYIARGPHLDAIRRNGLTIESVHGDLRLPFVRVTDDPAEVGAVDVVLFAVKLWDTETAAAAARPLIGPSTRLITLQNGVDSVERISAVLGAERTVGGTAYIATVIASPGVIKHTSSFATLRVGRADRQEDETLAAFVAAAKAARLDVDLSAAIERDIWHKFIFLTAMAGATAALRSPIGPIRDDPELREFFRTLMQEALAVGRATGIALDPAYVDERMDFLMTKVEPNMKASMAHDLERGNRLELDWLTGKVRALGRAFGIPTPASDAVYTVLKLHRLGRP